MPKVTVIIIHFNTPNYIKSCLDSLLKQTHKNMEIIFIDNNPPEHTGVEIVKKKYPHVQLIKNPENTGYSGAAEQGLELAKGSKYLFITNPDIIFEPNYFAKAIEKMEKSPKLAALTGKVKKYDFENHQQTNNIDTVGLFSFPNRRIIDDGQGLPDDGRFDEEKEVFGISGACPLYRVEALESIRINGECYDKDFFMYKEDVDVAWRMQLFGWKALYYPDIVAWHGRGTGVLKRFTSWQVFKNRSKLSRFQKFYSFRNQRLMQLKNEQWGNALRHPFEILMKEFLIFFYVLLRAPYLFRAYWHIIKMAPSALRKRREIMKNKKVTAAQMEKWFGQSQSQYYE